ncbi:hypothetical protein PPL_06909 [Heterostelium album PN500]|uniref:Uncharacterized protein n=1 Tax=Heterostelium pallidum (strain ATCC 26659 / Pp 5 / PN500) TaxID=670386 RepID=D3BDV6_HETP5|nr:hypothetical protein PPL_06909 [Heterostelium album PN500]EFA80087.1 hypothetical protein PPL_06909 [Heterostelium album PN500]|eukprot:XP_020432207.1 hypothetical protein PPL_06909 [Heterostelium album PN500]
MTSCVDNYTIYLNSSDSIHSPGSIGGRTCPLILIDPPLDIYRFEQAGLRIFLDVNWLNQNVAISTMTIKSSKGTQTLSNVMANLTFDNNNHMYTLVINHRLNK